ncbi:MAG: 4'-phosphopantetheinyl transferase superfamily protein [Reichenbachiella sp.]
MINQFYKSSEHCLTAVGEIEKDDSLNLNHLSPVERRRIADYHPSKLAEHLASRRLIRILCKEKGIHFHGIEKDKHGKPHLINSDHYISISHSYPYVACMLHLDKPCGIDIESPREQLVRIKNKYLNPEELVICQDNIDTLCQYWCAKETVYKIFGRKNLSFKQDIKIVSLDKLTSQVDISKTGMESTHHLSIQRHKDYWLTFGV